MSEELAEIIRGEIAAVGPIPFSRWMELCLYEPAHGYYMRPGRKTGTGRDADFATSPTTHPFFAHAVAAEAAATWRALGRPEGFRIVELGGGEGDLARDGLAWLDLHDPALGEKVQWQHYEISGTHRVRQALSRDPRIGWTSGGSRGTWGPGFVVANEFLDARPHRWLEWDGKDWLEVHVQASGGGFSEVLLPARDLEADALPSIAPTVGQRIAIPDFAEGALLHVFGNDWVLGGSILIADYGDRAERLWTQDRMAGGIRGFRKHALVDSVLEQPGETDITASVDFTQTANIASGFWDGGPWKEALFETQEQFLLRHGILDKLNRIDRNTVEGASSYLRLRQLLLPTGMGKAFKVQRFDRIPSK